MGSGSMGRDWKRTPNLTPRGYEIKRDELYVLSGELLIQMYHLLMSQRISSLVILSKIPPTEGPVYEEYLQISKHINEVLNDILQSMPLVSILQMQDEARLEEERSKNSTVSGLTLKEILAKYHLSEGGKKDESKKSPPPPENGTPKI